MKLIFEFRDPKTKPIVEMINKNGNVMSNEDIVERAFELFSVEADIEAGIRLAKEIKLVIPKNWYELSLKKAVEVGDFLSAAKSSEELNRELTQKEILSLIEMTILKGDMISLYNIQNFSSEIFHLSIWQNTFLIRVVRMLWENKYEERSSFSSLLSFHKDFSEIISEFEIDTRQVVTFGPLKRSFRLFGNSTMSQFLFAQSQLGDYKFVRDISRNITRLSPAY